MKKWKIGIISGVVIAVVAMIVIAAIGLDKDSVIDSYYALSNKPENSARQFKIPFGYITVNSDGTINIEFASSVHTISSDIDVADNDFIGANPEDDTQGGGNGSGGGNGPGNGNGGQPGDSNGGVAPPPNPINGDTIVFPPIGTSVWYREINTEKTGYLDRVGPDVTSWEFAFGYITTTDKWATMRKRAEKIAPYVTNASSNDALKVNLGGESYYVGCLPISGFGKLGDIIEFKMDNGSSFKVLAIDAKSSNDAKGSGSTGQCNTQYCHGVLAGNGIKLSAIELWCGGKKTADGNKSSIPGGNVVEAKIVGHWDGFN